MNYREIDLNLLMILYAMYDAGSTTLVAERLHTRPTLAIEWTTARTIPSRSFAMHSDGTHARTGRVLHVCGVSGFLGCRCL